MIDHGLSSDFVYTPLLKNREKQWTELEQITFFFCPHYNVFLDSKLGCISSFLKIPQRVVLKLKYKRTFVDSIVIRYVGFKPVHRDGQKLIWILFHPHVDLWFFYFICRTFDLPMPRPVWTKKRKRSLKRHLVLIKVCKTFKYTTLIYVVA